MPETTRRTFLLRSGAGAAAAGAIAFTPGIAEASTPGSGALLPPSTALQPGAALPPGAADSGPLVAYIDDVSSGDISVLVGDRAVVLHDPGFVAALAHAAAGTTTTDTSKGR